MFSIAMKFLYGKLQETTWEEFSKSLASIPPMNLAFGLVLVAFNYFVLTFNDAIAVEYAGGKIPYRRTALASFLGYALGNNVGTVIAGIPIRARFYGSWGLSPVQIASIIGFLGLSFWIGFLAFGGAILSSVEIPVPPKYQIGVTTKTLGYLLLGAASAYALLCTFWQRALSFRGATLRPPGRTLMVKQIVVASLDLAIVSTTLYVLLPPDTPTPFLQIVAGYLFALAVAMILQVPGGLGVLEGILVVLIQSGENSTLLGSLLVFRIYYYVIPLILAAAILIVTEIQGAASKKATERN